ncbi:hypothetical protein P9112_006522 [Eukaryota sp. TZLM1-RC]
MRPSSAKPPPLKAIKPSLYTRRNLIIFLTVVFILWTGWLLFYFVDRGGPMKQQFYADVNDSGFQAVSFSCAFDLEYLSLYRKVGGVQTLCIDDVLTTLPPCVKSSTSCKNIIGSILQPMPNDVVETGKNEIPSLFGTRHCMIYSSGNNTWCLRNGFVFEYCIGGSCLNFFNHKRVFFFSSYFDPLC